MITCSTFFFFPALTPLVRPRRAHSRRRARLPCTFHMGALWPLSLLQPLNSTWQCRNMFLRAVHKWTAANNSDHSQSQSWEVCWRCCSEWPLGSNVQQSCQRQVWKKNPKPFQFLNACWWRQINDVKLISRHYNLINKNTNTAVTRVRRSFADFILLLHFRSSLSSKGKHWHGCLKFKCFSLYWILFMSI